MILQPRFACDDEVRVIRNLRNDGTYPGYATGTLLVRRGSVGFVRHIGVFLQDQIIYSVHFLEAGNRIVGCRETELIPADAPWVPNRFERGDQVTAKLALSIDGAVAVNPGMSGAVLAVLREPDTTADYHVLFGQRLLCVPESALDAATPD
ncbi:nitrogen fixation protein NifZ [Candidatus Competibacter phosphatis]|uniref:nitrogen fixation protein NifZ n=1 Tax=Candidatus Competibacter phosphatis TaxID=221280 RepID=UPI0028A68137|nr:nitrogen fixation protein NifZ [Candidatus Competibacter phosphatis]